jgi:hypothetical protein
MLAKLSSVCSCSVIWRSVPTDREVAREPERGRVVKRVLRADTVADVAVGCFGVVVWDCTDWEDIEDA